MVADNPYGVTCQINSNNGFAQPSWVYSQIAAAGAAWIRIQVPLSATFPDSNPADWVWSYSDTAIQAANALGINVLYDLTSAPAWVRTVNVPGSSHTQWGVSTTTTLMTAIATRYKPGSANGTIAAMDFNEDFDNQANGDLANNFGFCADILNTAYAQVKAIYHGLIIGGPAHLLIGHSNMGNQQTNFYTGGGVSQSGGVGNNCDFSNVHFYRGVLEPPDNTFDQPNNCNFAQALGIVHNVDMLYGLIERPIWVTEVGWPATQNGDGSHVSWAQQSQYLQYCYAVAMSCCYCSHLFPYTLTANDSYTINQQNQTLAAYLMWENQIAAYPQWPCTLPEFVGTLPNRGKIDAQFFGSIGIG